MQLTQATTRTLEAPGATLTYDVRPAGGGDIPLFLIGSPMGAAGFGSLASHFPDRTRSWPTSRRLRRSCRRGEREGGSPRDQRLLPARWLRRRHGALHGDHEPPRPVPRRHRSAARPGPLNVRPAGQRRRLPDRRHARPEPHQHDALRARLRRATGGFDPTGGRRGCRVGRRDGESGAYGVAQRLATEPAIFPSHHAGFLGGEYGWPGEPDAFAAKLRDILDAED